MYYIVDHCLFIIFEEVKDEGELRWAEYIRQDQDNKLLLRRIIKGLVFKDLLIEGLTDE